MYVIASKMACRLAVETGLEQKKVDYVRFGLEVILGEAIKITVLLMTALLLGVLPGALCAMVFMCLFRLVSGGEHCQDYWRCLVFSMLVFIGSAEAGFFLSPFINHNFLVILVVVSFIFMAVLVIAWAPGEVVHRRIKPEERPLFKVLSLLFLICWSIVTIFIIIPRSFPVAAAGLLAMVIQTVSFTPAGYWFINRFDIILSTLLGERRCPPDAENA